jgi:hypothetical protein
MERNGINGYLWIALGIVITIAFYLMNFLEITGMTIPNEPIGKEPIIFITFYVVISLILSTIISPIIEFFIRVIKRIRKT